MFALSCEIARRLKRNGVLSDWSRGLVVAAVDGIEICSSFARCCDACMERVQHKVNGEMKSEIQYYHRIVVVVLVSTSFPIPLGVRFQKNGEAEVGWSKPFASNSSAASRSAKKTVIEPNARPPVAQPSTNFYATNFELGSISPLFIHPAVHQTTALVVLTMIRLLAYTLSLLFYHRQVCSHARRKCHTFHALAKRLAYWFLALSPNTS